MNIALVHEWITNVSGSERVLLALKEIYPEADIYTSVFDAEKAKIFKNHKVITSYLQNHKIFLKKREALIPYAPLAFESFDLSKYDLVISNSTFAAKGVITKPETAHICYCHTPTRYLWEPNLDSRASSGSFSYLRKKVSHELRTWDFAAAQTPDYYLANSKTVQDRIKKYYRRDSRIVYPPVDIDRFKPHISGKDGDHYLFVSRLIDYKRADIVIEAFNDNGYKLVVVGSGPDKEKLMKKSKNNIEFTGMIGDDKLLEYYQNSKAFVFTAEEDFGIVPVEAMACGKPVITYGRGGASETVIDGETGVFFYEQSAKALNEAIKKFLKMNFSKKMIRLRAEEFSRKKFMEVFKSEVASFLK